MRFLLAAAVFVTALAVDVRPAPARVAHVAAPSPWCVIHNTGHAEWTCFPSRALCHRFGERPGGGAEYCVRYPVWSGRR
jgi:hypothetical protein